MILQLLLCFHSTHFQAKSGGGGGGGGGGSGGMRWDRGGRAKRLTMKCVCAFFASVCYNYHMLHSLFEDRQMQILGQTTSL